MSPGLAFAVQVKAAGLVKGNIRGCVLRDRIRTRLVTGYPGRLAGSRRERDHRMPPRSSHHDENSAPRG